MNQAEQILYKILQKVTKHGKNTYVMFKSDEENYKNEENGDKSNTERITDYYDERFTCKPTHIIIKHSKKPKFFIRKLSNITQWENITIYSWRP